MKKITVCAGNFEVSIETDETHVSSETLINQSLVALKYMKSLSEEGDEATGGTPPDKTDMHIAGSELKGTETEEPERIHHMQRYIR